MLLYLRLCILPFCMKWSHRGWELGFLEATFRLYLPDAFIQLIVIATKYANFLTFKEKKMQTR